MPAPELVTAADATAWGVTVSTAHRLAASAAVRRACGWHIAPSWQQALTLDLDSSVVFLPAMEVTALSATANGAPITDPQWSTYGSFDVPYVSYKRRALVVTFTSGYATTPEDIVGLVLGIAQRIPQLSETVREVAGPFELQRSTGGGLRLSKSEIDALAPYRLPVVR